MPLISWREALFSVKAFGAAMLALYIAMSLGLTNPSWAMMTAYIVAQPFSSMAMAKGMARFIGTLVGASVSLALMITLVNAPLLHMLGLSLWLAACLYLSLLEKSVFNYAFMLSGYTALFVSLPYVNAPQDLFNVVLTRVEEIGLGISCYMLVDLLVFPRRTDSLYLAQIAQWLQQAARWQMTLLATPPQRHGTQRQNLLAQLRQLDELRQHALRDSALLRGHQNVLLELQCRLQEQYTLTLAIEDRLIHLQDHQPELLARNKLLLGETHKAILLFSGGQALPGMATLLQRLREANANDRPEPADPLHHQASLAVLLPELLQNHQQGRSLLRLLDSAPLRRRQTVRFAHHRDPLQAAICAGVAALSVLIIASFWYFTGWQDGYIAVMMTGIACSLFASADNPLQPAKSFFIYSLMGVPIVTLYQYVVFPLIHDFGALLLVLAPFYLWAGYQMARPATAAKFTPLLLGSTVLLAISNDSAPSFLSLLNQAMAQQIGMGLPLLLLGILRKVGSESIAKRLHRALEQQLIEAACGPVRSRVEFESQYQEIMHGLLLRSGTRAAEVAQGAGAALRIGLALLVLRAQQPSLLPHARKALQQAREAIADYFNRRDAQTPARMQELLQTLHRTQQQLAQPVGATPPELQQRLGGLLQALERQQNFFIHAPSTTASALIRNAHHAQ